jgi:hypothetical protein
MTTELAQAAIPGLMTVEQASEAVWRIRTHAKSVRALLRDLELRQGWVALKYRSFDAMLEAEFDWSPGYAHRQIRAAEVEESLSLPIGTIREAQARELFPLPVEVRCAVWEKVGTDGVTAKRIREVAAEVRSPEPTLPEGEGQVSESLDPTPPQVVTRPCRECGRAFEQELGVGEKAEGTCPRCQKRAEAREQAAQPGVAAPEPMLISECCVVCGATFRTEIRPGETLDPKAAPATCPGCAPLSHPEDEPPGPCPACGAERAWDYLDDGAVNACCNACGRVGAHDDRPHPYAPLEDRPLGWAEEQEAGQREAEKGWSASASPRLHVEESTGGGIVECPDPHALLSAEDAEILETVRRVGEESGKGWRWVLAAISRPSFAKRMG